MAKKNYHNLLPNCYANNSTNDINIHIWGYNSMTMRWKIPLLRIFVALLYVTQMFEGQYITQRQASRLAPMLFFLLLTQGSG